MQPIAQKFEKNAQLSAKTLVILSSQSQSQIYDISLQK